MPDRAQSHYCEAVVFLDDLDVCQECKRSGYDIGQDAEAFDFGYRFESFTAAAAKARHLATTFRHDVYITPLPEDPGLRILAMSATCVYALIEATHTPFDHVNSPWHYMGPYEQVATKATFDETFEHFRRMLVNPDRRIMMFPVPDAPFWTIVQSGGVMKDGDLPEPTDTWTYWEHFREPYAKHGFANAAVLKRRRSTRTTEFDASDHQSAAPNAGAEDDVRLEAEFETDNGLDDNMAVEPTDGAEWENDVADEIASDREDWARSDEDGWFYSD